VTDLQGESGPRGRADLVRPSEALGAAPSYAALLRALREEVREIGARAEERFGALDEAQLAWAPGKRRWGVGQCLEHLLLTNGYYLERLEGAADALGGSVREPGVAVLEGWLGRWLVRCVGPDSRWPLPAPRFLHPRRTAELEAADRSPPGGARAVVADFLSQQNEILRLLRKAEDLPMDRTRISSPATRLVRLRASDALRMVVAHEWRHLAQAERVLEHPDFPR
jgi:hypothetical protein